MKLSPCIRHKQIPETIKIVIHRTYSQLLYPDFVMCSINDVHIHCNSFFFSKVNICNVNCASVQVLRQKMSRPEGDSNPNHRFHAECFNLLSNMGPDICCPMFLNTGSSGVDIFE